MTPEGEVKAEVKKFLAALGADCWYYMPVPMGYGRRGVKDFIGAYKGKAFAIETKALRKKLNPWQQTETDYCIGARVVVFDFSPGYTFECFKQDFIAIMGVPDGL